MGSDLARRQFLGRIAAASTALAVMKPSAAAVAAPDTFLTSAKLEDFDFYYEAHGEGPAVIFAHGSGGTHMSWWQQVPALSKHYTCITIDHRTFGYSRDKPGGPGRRAFVQDLKGLLDRLGVQKAALVGQSMGGNTVLGFASAYPDRVNALIMSDTTGGYSNPEIADLRRKFPAVTASIATAFAPDFAAREPERLFLYREISALTLGGGLPQSGVPPLPSAQSAAPPAGGPDLQPVLDKNIPVLFIVGDKDMLIPPPIVEAMHRRMPGSELARVAGAGHSVYFEKPEDYNRILLEFLGKHVRGV
jgi:pimeloyl-ACP methyl ester carboxylesterase